MTTAASTRSWLFSFGHWRACSNQRGEATDSDFAATQGRLQSVRRHCHTRMCIHASLVGTPWKNKRVVSLPEVLQHITLRQWICIISVKWYITNFTIDFELKCFRTEQNKWCLSLENWKSQAGGISTCYSPIEQIISRLSSPIQQSPKFRFKIKVMLINNHTAY